MGGRRALFWKSPAIKAQQGFRWLA